MSDSPRRPLPPPPAEPRRQGTGADSETPPPTARGTAIADEPTFQAHPSAFVGAAAAEDADEITERRETLAPAIERTVPALTVLTGKKQGQLLQLDPATSRLGRGKGADIILADIGVSREHARIKRWIGQAFVLEDLGSTNGTFVNGKRVQRRSLANGDIVQLGPNLRLRFDVIDASEAELRRMLFAGNVRDPTTRLYRRDHLEEQVRLEVAHGRRHESDVALLLVRVDEPVALEPRPEDRLVGQVAARVVERGRIEDLIARFDTRTIAMLQRATDLAAARTMATSIAASMTAPFELDGRAVHVEVSMGIATLEHMEVFAEYDALLEDAASYLDAAADGPDGRIGHP